MTGWASMPRRINRRRFLLISATAAAGVVLPALAAASRARLHVRRDVLLGAETELRLYHPDARTARRAMDACFSEVHRLETIFGLQRPDSALSRLNRDGSLSHPPAELVALLDIAAGFSRATGGAFDVTVQALWELYAHHFASDPADPLGPAMSDIQRALACVDYRQVEVSHRLVTFNRPGMAVTLNGIAQGFITDRVTEMLRNRGFEHVLVNMGEMRALRGAPDGTAWRVGIADPEQPWRSLHTLPLIEQAIATSGAYGMLFDADGRHHHLFDPHTGRSPHYYRSVSVIAPDATTADALSTGLSALPPETALSVVNARPEVRALLIGTDGKTWM